MTPRQRYERNRTALIGFVIFQIFLPAWVLLAPNNVDIYIAVDYVFRVFPIGFISSLVLLLGYEALEPVPLLTAAELFHR